MVGGGLGWGGILYAPFLSVEQTCLLSVVSVFCAAQFYICLKVKSSWRKVEVKVQLVPASAVHSVAKVQA